MFFVPIVLWDATPPSCTITCILLTEASQDGMRMLVTGTSTGQIVFWDTYPEVGKSKVGSSGCLSAVVLLAVVLLTVTISSSSSSSSSRSSSSSSSSNSSSRTMV